MTNQPLGRVDVVWARPGEVLRAGVDTVAGLLDDVERSRLAVLSKTDDRDRFVAAHALLRITVGRFVGVAPVDVAVTSTCATCGGPHGRPVITPGSRGAPQVSLSHSGDRVVVAVTYAGPVGVDVEPLEAGAFTDDGFDRIALTVTERQAVQALPPWRRSVARAQLWVRKEALLKATGQGLQVEPSRVPVTEGVPGPVPGTQLVDLDLGQGYAACLAVLSPVDLVVTVDRSARPG